MILTDLQPHQQCAAIVSQLGGAARDMARMLTPQEVMHGGQLVAGGPQVDPVTYLLGSLHSRFSPLEEESRMTTMTEPSIRSLAWRGYQLYALSLRDRTPTRSSRRTARYADGVLCPPNP